MKENNELMNKKKREKSSFIREYFARDVLEFETSARATLLIS
jgi:hypothetical protein